MGSMVLHERDGAVGELGAAFEAVLAGHGRLVTVDGPAGTGKSSLLEAASAQGSSAGLLVLSARGSELERELPFGAIRQLFETLVTNSTPAEREQLLAGAAAAGGNARRLARTGLDSLTASERRVARMVADGRSNPEVAQDLFISLKTVESHLSNAYAKLGLSGHGSRRRLGGALQAAERREEEV